MRAAALSAGAALLLAAGAASAQPAGGRPAAGTFTAGYGAPGTGYYLLPQTLPYDEGEPIPLGYTLKTRMHRPLVISGSVVFGSAYALSILVGATVLGGGSQEASSFTPLFVPCVGPFIAAGTVRTDGVGQFWLTLDGLTQSAGVAMFVAGVLTEQKYLQRTPPPSAKSALLRPEVDLGPRSARLTWHF